LNGVRQATQAGAEDLDLFEGLIGRYQGMAFGYALSLLRDYHLAQDATQEALFIAYTNLPKLREPKAFPGWLRGIVHHQCCRYLRVRHFDVVSLDEAIGVPEAAVCPERQLEITEGFHRVLAAIRALPEPQREVGLLFYIKDYSHREIAAFLELPLTTVNNRLHGARQALRRRLAMANNKVGRVVAVEGPVVDVRFAPEDMPLILSALTPSGGEESGKEALQVVQRMGDGLARCLARGPEGTVFAPGATVADTGGPLLAPVDVRTLTEALPLLGAITGGETQAHGRGDTPPRVLETGIKVIDLLCPYAAGGALGIFGPSGTGRMVVSAEVLRNTARDERGATLFAFVHGESEGRGWYDEPGAVPRPTGAGGLVCLPIDNSIDASSPAVLAGSSLLDARTYLSFTLAKAGVWPAVDPLLSTSRLMDPAIVGQKHYEVARGVRDLLRRYRELQEGAPDGKTRTLSAEDRTLMARARRVQRFLTQPFFVAEPFTKRAGQYVSRADTVRGFKALLDGAYDDLPEDAFLWRGSIEQAVEHARALQGVVSTGSAVC